MGRIATSTAAVAAATALSVLGLASPAAAATVTVCASGCDTTTIQAAVDAAAPGDTITVAAGTYSEVVTINKAGLVLQGAQAGVDARTRTGAETVISQGQFRFGANDITIDGFTFDDARNAGNPAAGVYGGTTFAGMRVLNNIFADSMFGVQFSNAGPAQAVIAYNVFDHNNVNYPTGGTGILMLGGTNVLITENDFFGHQNAAINVNTSDIVISNNVGTGDATLVVAVNSSNALITGNALIDGFGGSGIYLGLGNSGVTVSDNILQSVGTDGDNFAAIRIAADYGSGPSEDYLITGNEVSGGWVHAIRRSVGALTGVLEAHDNDFGMKVTNEDPDPENVIDATGNWWAPTVDLAAMDNVDAAAPCQNEGCTVPAAPLLPATGGDATGVLLVGGLLAAVGALLLSLRRRTEEA